MIKVFTYLLIIILFISTAFIGTKRPKLHKTVLIYDSGFQIETVKEDSSPKKETEILPQKVVKKEVKIQPKEVITKKETKVQVQPVQKTTKKEIKENKVTVKIEEKPKSEPVQLTAEEELIQWNIWRSNLQNSIMKDTKLPTLPSGTVFKFSFDVDKFGKISNITTYSTNAIYTPYAIQYIAPVIKSYQGKEILTFPKGSTRYQTKFEGGWKISNIEKYSTPENYHDLEKVRK